MPWSCIVCTPVSGQPSWWSWPSCGRQAWSDHRNRTAYGRNDAYPERRGKPVKYMSSCRQCISSQGRHPYLASLVLGDLVLGVLLAVLALAVSAASLGNVDLESASISNCSRGSVLLCAVSFCCNCRSRSARADLGVSVVSHRLFRPV